MELLVVVDDGFLGGDFLEERDDGGCLLLLPC